MEKLPMCRICLAENVHMYVVVNKSLHEFYERLTDVPFLTEDGRPILACAFCCTKLKQCFRFMRKCLEAEELFAQMMNEDYEPNPSINPDHLEFMGGLAKTEIQTINIVDVVQIDSIVKEELPAVCERLDDIIELKEDFKVVDFKQEILDSGDSDTEQNVPFPPLFFEEGSEDEIPVMEVKIEVEEVEEGAKQKPHILKTYKSAIAKKLKLATGGTKIEDKIAAKQKKNVLSDSNIIQNIHIHTSKRITEFQENFTDTKPRILNNNNDVNDSISRKKRIRGRKTPFMCDICQKSFNHKGHFTRHVRNHTGEKPYKCDICHRSFAQLSNLKRHVLTHDGEKPYKCDLCQCCYIDRRDLEKHVREKHMGEKPFHCKICRFSCNDKRVLTKHFRKHTGKKAFECEICQKGFNYPSDLKKHVRKHTGEKPYICDICQSSYNVKSNLKRHILEHTCAKPCVM